MNVIGTGLSGLVGTRILEILETSHTFENLSLETGIDITNQKEVQDRIRASSASCMVHLAAVTDVDAIEKEKERGEQSLAWRVNVEATKYVVDACIETKKKLLYISTDYVFDGTKDFYTESDVPHPQSWYAKTKYEGEKLVAALGELGTIFRIANPYRASQIEKKDFIEKMRVRLSEGTPVVAPTDQLLMPTFIDDIARALGRWIETDMPGLYHVVGSQAVSPYDIALALAKQFGYNESLVQPTSFAVYFSNRAPRPLRAVLKNDKITRLGIAPMRFDEGIIKIHEYWSSHTL